METHKFKLSSVKCRRKGDESSAPRDINTVKSLATWVTQTCRANHWSTSYPSAIAWSHVKDQANMFQQRIEALPSFTTLCEVLRAGEQLMQFCDNPTFVKEFSHNGGLSLLMRIISGESIHDVRQIILTSIKVFLMLTDIKEDPQSYSTIMLHVCHDALGALPRLVKMTSDSDELVQLASLTLINLVLDRAGRETREIMIKQLKEVSAKFSNVVTSNSLETTRERNHVSNAIIRQKEDLKKKMKATGTQLDSQSGETQPREEYQSCLHLLQSLGNSQTIPSMAEFVKCIASTPTGLGVPGSNKNFHEKRALLTFLDALIDQGIAAEPEEIEVHFIGKGKTEETLTDLFEVNNPGHEIGPSKVTHFTKTGTFLVSVDSDPEREDDDDGTFYYNLVGNFIDSIDRVTSAVGIKPRVALVTKAKEPQNRARQLAETAKAHLETLDMNINNVSLFSLEEEQCHEKIETLSRDINIVTRLFRCRPYSWQRLSEELKRRMFVNIEEVKTMMQQAFEVVKDKRSETEKEILMKMKEITMYMMRIPAADGPKKRENMEVVLDFLQDKGEVLRFNKVERLASLVITQPEKLSRILSAVLNQKKVQRIRGSDFDERAKDVLSKKGLISYQAFTELHRKLQDENDFSVDQVWEVLVELGLICPLEKDSKTYGLVPSLISSKTAKKMLEDEVTISKNPESVCLQFVSLKNRGSQGMYFNFLRDFSKAFLWGEMGGEITVAWSQNIEGRQLGPVGGVQGVLRWHEEGVQEPQEYRFLILEWEGNIQASHVEEDPYSKSFARHRVVRLHLLPKQGDLRTPVLEILSKVNEVVSTNLGSVRRLLSCKPCQLGGKPGFFELGEDLQLESEYDECSELEHAPDEKKVLQLRKDFAREKPFKLASLMKMPKENLGLEQFQSSKIKKNMLRGHLSKGEQIWIHHDAESDPFNPVARMNPYAHVVVYVGPTEVDGHKVHEVVHVSKKAMLCGFVKASIVKEDVMSVIQPHEKVFLGHKINKVKYYEVVVTETTHAGAVRG